MDCLVGIKREYLKDFEVEFDSRVKKVRKAIKRKYYWVKIFVGEDLGVKLVIYFVGKKLISKFMGIQIYEVSLNEWMKKAWVLIIGYVPSF